MFGKNTDSITLRWFDDILESLLYFRLDIYLQIFIVQFLILIM